MVIRRRWKWIALGLAMGLFAGFASTLAGGDAPDTTAYYKATNTLIYNAGGPAGSSETTPLPNLARTAFLVRSADVANGVAEAIGVTVSDVNEQVNGVARSDVQAIDITAISTDPAQAVLLADTTARVLNDYIATDQQHQYATARDEILQELDLLNAQRADLEARIGSDPTNAAFYQEQLQPIDERYTTTYEQLQALTAQGSLVGGFTTLQTASPVQINPNAYDDRLQANREARGGATMVLPQTDSATARETDLSTPTTVSDRTRILIGAGTGLVLGLFTAFLVEAWDDRLRRSERVEAVTGLPVLVEVPVLPRNERQVGRIIVLDEPRSPAAERYRTLRTSIQFALRKRVEANSGNGAATQPASNVVLITSPNPGDGKTTTVANLAATLGDAGVRVLVIDCDHRRPSVGRYLDPALTFDQHSEPTATRLANVWFMPPPTADGATPDLLPELTNTIRTWRDRFDIVLLDTPPMLMMNDALGLLPESDSVVMVVRAGQTRVGQAERAVSLIERFQANLMGVVLNSCSARDSAHRYGYGYYRDHAAKRPRARSNADVGGDDAPGANAVALDDVAVPNPGAAPTAPTAPTE
ncbi:MAG TPA: division plane positioning ATPase MipZ [Acidimicrobiales bacterium]